MPKLERPLSAVVVSGGKQYHVAPGDQILVDRLSSEPGSTLKLGRVLLVHDGAEVKVGTPVVGGLEVEAKVVRHTRGPRIESLRYKSKKRVRVRRGGRADLTQLAIVAIHGATKSRAAADAASPKEESEAKAPGRGKRKSVAVAEATGAGTKRAGRKPAKDE